jgi:hypothetical protein
MGIEKRCRGCLVLAVCKSKTDLSCEIFANAKIDFDELSRIMGREVVSVSYPSHLRKRDRDKEREERAFGAYMRRHCK